MISQSKWYGGSLNHLSNLTLTLGMNSPRLIRTNSVDISGPTIKLPDLTNVILTDRDYGGRRFIIIREGTFSASIQKFDGTPLATVPVGSAAYVSLYKSSGVPTWSVIVVSRSAVRPVGHSVRGSLVSETTTKTYAPADLFCFVGTDCEFAQALPLDGQGGRDKVVVPMFMNPCVTAQNVNREAVRGADVIMPTTAILRLSKSCFEIDASHPLTQAMPQEFFDALDNNGDPILLAYDNAAKLTGSTSRNPYHLRRTRTSNTWSFGTVSCTKLFWKKQIQYTVGTTTYNIDVVLQAEHTVSAEPGLTGFTTDVSADQGGQNDPNDGAWGTLFMVYIFCDQISPGFSDGNNYDPSGGGGSFPFYRHDPLVWGNAPGVLGGNDDDKFAHPQLMCAAALPTTMHDPCKYEHIELEQRKIIPPNSKKGTNLEWGQRRANCVPWITSPTSQLPNLCVGCSDSSGIHKNTHFTHDLISDPYAAMTTGGDLPLSRPTELLCWENGAGIGRTFLKPLQAGWNEAIGELDNKASCGTISLCIDWDDNWSEYKFETCDGHPAEKWNNVGGTHRCFKTNATGNATQCCVQIANATCTWRKICSETFNQYGGRFGGFNTCSVIDFGCKETGSYTTSVTMAVSDYTLAPSTNPILLRSINWEHWDVDPDSTLYSYTYDQTDVADMVQQVGSWTLGTTITTTPAGTETLTTMLEYDPTRNLSIDGDWRDATCSVEFRNATNITHGIGMRMTANVGDDATGYGAFIEPTGPGTGIVKIASYNVGVETVLGSKSITLDNDTVDVTFTIWGQDITFAWQVGSNPADTLTVNTDCAFAESDGPTLFTKGTGATAEFADWIIIDQSFQYIQHLAYLGSQNITVTGRDELMNSYGKCTDSSTGCCGTCCDPECCNCREWSETLHGDISTTWGGPGDLLGAPTPSDPTYCGGPFWDISCLTGWCGGAAIWQCGECPEPWQCINFCIPTRCFDNDPNSATFHYADDDEPNICKGTTKWCKSGESCS